MTFRRVCFSLGRTGSAMLLLALAGAVPAAAKNPLKVPGAQYEPTTWAQMEGWADDDHDATFASFIKSCNAILQGYQRCVKDHELEQVASMLRWARLAVLFGVSEEESWVNMAVRPGRPGSRARLARCHLASPRAAPGQNHFRWLPFAHSAKSPGT